MNATTYLQALSLLKEIVDWYGDHKEPEDWPLCVIAAREFVETKHE